MTTFFTADTHFGDHRTINIWRRPFASVAEMDALLIERWNATVTPEDEVWHLGDVARRTANVPGLLERLHVDDQRSHNAAPVLATVPHLWPEAHITRKAGQTGGLPFRRSCA